MEKAGDRIGPYMLLWQLGQGGFGRVWLAERSGSLATTKVAIKIPVDAQPDLSALRQEAQIWVRASGHPNVLPVIEAEVYGGQVVIVSEYAAGGSLLAWMQQQPSGKATPKKAAELAAGICAGLAHLHEQGLVHRDLKPGNVLLQGMQPRLTDFGLARVMHATQQAHSIAGTPAYMAPEAWEGIHSEAADIWSAGVILYELIEGKKPFPQTEIMPLFRAISHAPFPAVAVDFPSPLTEIVSRALQKDPSRRYCSAREMWDALAQVRTELDSSNVLMASWNRMDPELRDTLSLAFEMAKEEGKDRISTRTFFAAIASRSAGQMSDLLALLPPDSLPPSPAAKSPPAASATYCTFAAEEAPRVPPVEEPPSFLGSLLNYVIGGGQPTSVPQEIPDAAGRAEWIAKRLPKVRSPRGGLPSRVEEVKLSSCVENALVGLGPRLPEGEQLSVADLFVDVAKYGTGESVTRLRTHGVTPELIDRFVGQLGWKVLRRS